MRKPIAVMIAIITVLACVFSLNTIYAAGNGAISGQVVNKTQGGASLGSLDLTLTTFVNGNSSGTQQTTIDSAGRFGFIGLTVDPTFTYQVSATFQQALYTSDTITLATDNPTQTIELDVYDSTTSDANIQLANGHMVIYVDSGNLEVLEVWDFNNTGDKTYIGTQGTTSRQTLRFTLPDGATGLTPGQGFVSQTTTTGIVDTVPVPPGVVDDSFSYLIPYQGTAVTIARKMDYPVANFAVLVQDTGETVKSSTLIKSSPQNMSGTKFQYFTANNLPQGFNVDVTLNTAKTSSSIPWPWLIVGILVVGLVAILVYPRLKKRLVEAESTENETQETENSETEDNINIEENDLVDELSRLESDYKAGKLKREYYLKRRKEIKDMLLKVWKDDN